MRLVQTNIIYQLYIQNENWVSTQKVKKTIVKKEPITENSKSKTETKTDFDDFASQLA